MVATTTATNDTITVTIERQGVQILGHHDAVLVLIDAQIQFGLHIATNINICWGSVQIPPDILIQLWAAWCKVLGISSNSP